ncbi:lipid II:glycine glycyltransferase FemX [Emcibacter nanhaiensis]|uniref:lipid II:glycine glycyltransferase FemX n=1 Tax=Emcibacter nanhaiensis TaxID=1505037 RepID=UPI0015E2A842|nr:peptidoglycan bridge formation glycyltransferase FemA/FemB family protein [Emcibacter nanhaiensis]
MTGNSKRQIHLDWNTLDQVTWDGFLEKVDNCALQQSWAYGAALKEQGARVRRIVAYDGNHPIALAQVIVRSWFGLVKLATLMRGPVWLEEVSPQTRQEVYRQLRRLYPRRKMKFLFLTPEATGPEESALLEAAGLKQVITGYTTLFLDLGKSEQDIWLGLYGKWRNKIRKGEREGLKVLFGDHGHPKTEWLLSREKKQQRDKNYKALPVGLIDAYARHSLGRDVVMTAFVFNKESDPGKDDPVAGAIFLRHGNSVTYHIGWNGPDGRKLHAMNILLWKSILELKNRGCTFLDMGGMNTADGAEIARFKLGSGGEVATLPGTYL